MSVRVFSAAINGIDANLVEVEVDSSPGINSFHIVGLPDKAIEESRDRVASSIRHSKFAPPSTKSRKITVNLAPADMKKEGPSYDLPIAIGFLFETGQIKFDASKRLFVGELSLDGMLKPVNGTLSIAIFAKKAGFSEIVIPSKNTREAAIVKGISVIGADSILDVIGHLNGTRRISPIQREETTKNDAMIESCQDPFAYIRGQESAKRALEIAAAGSHNLLMSGPPGSGKTILAKAFRDILTPLSLSEAIDVARIYSSLGLLTDKSLSFHRPFRSPHHTTSPAAIIGGGAIPRPGEISLAHNGVLFLDELPEFPRNVLESLRQPLEEGAVTVSRAAGSITLPARFTLVAAMNPCPCGNHGDNNSECSCSSYQVEKYGKRLSGPLLDRMDIQIHVPRETLNSTDKEPADNSGVLAHERIVRAREIQSARYANLKISINSALSYKNIDNYCITEPNAESLLRTAVSSYGLSMRAYHKIKKIARTIADLDECEKIAQNHIAEAIKLRVSKIISA